MFGPTFKLCRSNCSAEAVNMRIGGNYLRNYCLQVNVDTESSQNTDFRNH